MGCGAWRAGPAPTTTRRRPRSSERVELGCNFFDTAWAYGNGRSEQMLGRLVRNHPDEELYVATKVPPKNFKWPSRRGYTLDDCFPPDHIRRIRREEPARILICRGSTYSSFTSGKIAGPTTKHWQRAVDDLKRQGLIRGAGVSVNRWEPANVLETLRTGLIDAVQVIFNIFDQSPAGRAVSRSAGS